MHISMISSATLLDGNLSVQVRLIFWGKPMQHSKPKKESFQLHSHLLRCISVSIQATTTSFAKSKSANLTRPSESTGIPLLDSSPLVVCLSSCHSLVVFLPQSFVSFSPPLLIRQLDVVHTPTATVVAAFGGAIFRHCYDGELLHQLLKQALTDTRRQSSEFHTRIQSPRTVRNHNLCMNSVACTLLPRAHRPDSSTKISKGSLLVSELLLSLQAVQCLAGF